MRKPPSSDRVPSGFRHGRPLLLPRKGRARPHTLAQPLWPATRPRIYLPTIRTFPLIGPDGQSAYRAPIPDVDTP